MSEPCLCLYFFPCHHLGDSVQHLAKILSATIVIHIITMKPSKDDKKIV